MSILTNNQDSVNYNQKERFFSHIRLLGKGWKQMRLCNRVSISATGRVTSFQLSLELSHKAQVEYCTESAKTFIWVFHVTKKLEWMFWPTQYDLPFIALSIYT